MLLCYIVILYYKTESSNGVIIFLHGKISFSQASLITFTIITLRAQSKPVKLLSKPAKPATKAFRMFLASFLKKLTPKS